MSDENSGTISNPVEQMHLLKAFRLACAIENEQGYKRTPGFRKVFFRYRDSNNLEMAVCADIQKVGKNYRFNAGLVTFGTKQENKVEIMANCETERELALLIKDAYRVYINGLPRADQIDYIN